MRSEDLQGKRDSRKLPMPVIRNRITQLSKDPFWSKEPTKTIAFSVSKRISNALALIDTFNLSAMYSMPLIVLLNVYSGFQICTFIPLIRCVSIGFACGFICSISFETFSVIH